MMLDIVEMLLKHLKHRYVRLDGSTPIADRSELCHIQCIEVRPTEANNSFLFLQDLVKIYLVTSNSNSIKLPTTVLCSGTIVHA